MVGSNRTVWTRVAVMAAVPLLAVTALAGCSDDDEKSDTTTTTTAGGDTSDTTTAAEEEATVKFDEEIQTELQEVGCYEGGIDGVIGPETDAAIVNFQTAKGLEVDGELGPETEAALTTAVDDGETDVCATTTSTTAGGSTTTTGGSDTAPCTATAISAALTSGQTLQSYVCSGGYAAGTSTDSAGTQSNFIFQDEDGSWVQPGQDPCGTASAGLPAIILEDGCPA